MNFFSTSWPKTRRDMRDELVELLDRETGGSLVTLTSALDAVASKAGTDAPLDIDQVIEEIRRIRAGAKTAIKVTTGTN